MKLDPQDRLPILKDMRKCPNCKKTMVKFQYGPMVHYRCFNCGAVIDYLEDLPSQKPENPADPPS